MGGDQMSKKERVFASLRGQDVDRPAWSLWRHFYEAEETADGLARAMLAFQQAYQFDFMKVNPRAHYHVEGWGVRYEYPGQGAPPKQRTSAIKSPDDWRRLRPLPPDSGALGEQLEALRLIKNGLREELPFVETIFNPISVAGDLVDDDAQLVRDIQEHPDAVHEGLEAITETFVNFAQACLDVGVSGIFFATTTWATRNTLTEEEYAAIALPYDLRVLAAILGADFNVLHVCQPNNMLYKLGDYPVHALNWAVTDPTNPTLAEVAQRIPGKALIGGVSSPALVAPTPDMALGEVRSAHAQTQGRHWMLGPNCSVDTRSRSANLDSIKALVASL